ncbi:uncharacterized protein PHACADRAFT_145272 [Phanerochaete carnosa HHB-10118-sp]|uniref:tripeptidyl-peptidase II n=1 Tax=Phanerochaete carnosa (strain HHB-10118-sp) TaxID=650164 RepID=K5X046_PHACS|nr:uncharacterized protein PHACADRAFT_145272 [Phanerochaete carnosa HHB-10118-sp]EKM56142.1 hypothetical protein PHACADRAFT_145272 [Phanerochaete carnosa HHB-10118-sp]
MMVSTLIALSSLFALAFASPVARRMKVLESRALPAAGFVRTGPAAANTTLDLRIALVQSNTDTLIEALYNVSTPGHPSYGQHLSKEEVEQLVAPSTESITAVNAWLQQAGVNATTMTPAGDWLSISVPVSKANSLFDADFAVYTHSETGQQAVRTMEYSVPHALQGHVDFVHPTVSFPNPSSAKSFVTAPRPLGRSANLTARDTPCTPLSVTPNCVQTLYNIPSTKATQSSNQLGVSGFLNEFVNEIDLNTFLGKFRPDLGDTGFAVASLDGGSDSEQEGQAGLEASLDIQYTVGVASGVPVTFISVGEKNQDGLSGFLDIVNFLLNEPNPPQVLSTSYGNNEPLMPLSLVKNLCNAYAQLGARGTSILFASGDGGVSGEGQQNCTSFVPTFPSGCPFLTSVGATALTSPSTETGAPFSSGGFSGIFAVPSYQASVVQSYVSGLPSDIQSEFTSGMRGYPDVAAIGTNVEIILNGKNLTVLGTSCSTPIFASVVALINDELAAAGMSPLGFLNPFLYANPGAFNDITTGSNPGCGTNGFPAASGWDPVTGLGTPNYPALRAAAGL